MGAIRKRECIVNRENIPDEASFFGDIMKFPEKLQISVLHYAEKPDFWDEIVLPRYTSFPEEGILLIFCQMPSSMKATNMNSPKDK